MRIPAHRLAAIVLSAGILGGCYVVPVVDSQGNVQYATYPVPPNGAPPGAYPSAAQAPVAIAARLYPANEVAGQSGMITGSVTNMRTGKGRFQLVYQGETLIGEATRHGDGTQGIASAYGGNGTTMQCEYRMNTPVQGAGTCTFSNGARYTLHLGS